MKRLSLTHEQRQHLKLMLGGANHNKSSVTNLLNLMATPPAKTCQYIEGEVTAEPAFCGKPSVVGSYCLEHYRICYKSDKAIYCLERDACKSLGAYLCRRCAGVKRIKHSQAHQRQGGAFKANGTYK